MQNFSCLAKQYIKLVIYQLFSLVHFGSCCRKESKSIIFRFPFQTTLFPTTTFCPNRSLDDLRKRLSTSLNISFTSHWHYFVLLYEVCAKSNKTGVMKTLLKNIKIYQSQILQSNPLPLENTCAFAFSTIQNILGRHFLESF